jgi:hypothetical protein
MFGKALSKNGWIDRIKQVAVLVKPTSCFTKEVLHTFLKGLRKDSPGNAIDARRVYFYNSSTRKLRKRSPIDEIAVIKSI